MTQSISIHALREEGDISAKTYTAAVQAFLSTPSARRATLRDRRQRERRPISIHALREEGDSLAPILTDTFEISIHALREEGDQDWSDRMLDLILFLSTPSARRATARRL